MPKKLEDHRRVASQWSCFLLFACRPGQWYILVCRGLAPYVLTCWQTVHSKKPPPTGLCGRGTSRSVVSLAASRAATLGVSPLERDFSKNSFLISFAVFLFSPQSPSHRRMRVSFVPSRVVLIIFPSFFLPTSSVAGTITP